MEVIIITQNSKFIAVLNKDTDLNEWANTFIENNDQDIDFWEGGSIFVDSEEIIISGDNGSVFLAIEKHTI